MKKMLTALLLAAAIPLVAEVKPDFLFQDNFVFCAAKPARITGSAAPGEKVTVTMQGKTYEAVTGENGRFQVNIPAPGVIKKPFDVTISGEKNKVVLKNVLSGLVLFAGGQSNMEVPIKETMNWKAEVASADYPAIREFDVENDFDFAPRTQAKGKWVPVSPENAANIRATSFYCARVLHKEMDGIPIGIINNSVSATPQQAWLSPYSLLNVAPRWLNQYIKYSHMGRDGVIKYRDRLAASLVLSDPGKKANTAEWHKENFNDSAWKDITLPDVLEKVHGEMDGTYWFRKTFDVPAELAGKALTFAPGIIDDYDEVWLNGNLIGKTGDDVPDTWMVKRFYKIPAGALKAGKNTIAIRVFDSGHAGGLFDRNDDNGIAICAGKKVVLSLNGVWKTEAETVMKPVKWHPDYLELVKINRCGGVLYNAMFAPFRGTPVDAYLWYQGESNAGGSDFLVMLKEHIKSVRKVLNDNKLPFLMVQLAAYTAPVKDANKCGDWPRTRADQAAARVPNSVFMIPTIDIGDEKNIHPLNKQELGRRLALQLLQDVFKVPAFKGVMTYPEITSAVLKGNQIIVTMKNAAGLKTTDGKAPHSFAVSGPAVKVRYVWKEDYRFATAEIKDGKIIVTVPEGITDPETLRYAWTMNPEVNTVNGQGYPLLPAQIKLKK